MKLLDLITKDIQIEREKLIGREIRLLDEDVLLVAVQQLSYFDPDEQAYYDAVRLVTLHEEADEDDWDDEEEPYQTVQTVREELMEMNDMGDPTLTDACNFCIYGNDYVVHEAEELWAGDRAYHEMLTLKRAVEMDVIPHKWLEKDSDGLYFVNYNIDQEIMEVDWNVDILPMEVEFDNSGNELMVEQVMTFPCERLDVPMTFQLETPAGDIIDGKIYGTYLLDIWSDAACLDLDFDELEEVCARDEKLLVIEYDVESDVDVALNFYTTEFLESPAGEDRPLMLLGTEDHELRMLGTVPADFDGEVEVELFSIEVFED